MRLTTIASAAVLALSTAALAQVGTAPEEQKLPGNEVATPDETTPATNSVPSNTPTPVAEPGAPSTALVNSVNDEGGTPVGQRPPK